MIILEIMNAATPFRLKRNVKVTEFHRLTPERKDWKPIWVKILTMIEEGMVGRYSSLEILHSKELWLNFIAKTVPQTPQIRKAEGWVAAIEYIMSHLRETPMTLEKLGVRYQVSDLTIVKNIKRIQKALSSTYHAKDTYQFK